jgi:hypothetical protein
MSVRVLESAFAGSRARGVDRLVLLAIADRADQEGRAFPSLSDIARRSLINAKNVGRSLTALRHSASCGSSGAVGAEIRIGIGCYCSTNSATRRRLSPRVGNSLTMTVFAPVNSLKAMLFGSTGTASR